MAHMLFIIFWLLGYSSKFLWSAALVNTVYRSFEFSEYGTHRSPHNTIEATVLIMTRISFDRVLAVVQNTVEKRFHAELLKDHSTGLFEHTKQCWLPENKKKY